ncbi:MAG TPA: hypothetical protein VN461_16610 [Vicinamibacteria bacterium]|jgi:hypothetical protein|nr:hypothetical protein [Vicinamibacteria bacterium]
MRPALSIVLPAYNEEGNIERAFRTAAATATVLALARIWARLRGERRAALSAGARS